MNRLSLLSYPMFYEAILRVNKGEVLPRSQVSISTHSICNSYCLLVLIHKHTIFTLSMCNVVVLFDNNANFNFLSKKRLTRKTAGKHERNLK
jgi:hypothetical protein